MTAHNEYAQPIGEPVPDWQPVPLPDAETLSGQYCRLELLDPTRHTEDLYQAYAAADDDADWTYLPVGPFRTLESYRQWAIQAAQSTDPRHYTVIDQASGRALGTMSLLRHDPANGVIEVGFVIFSRALQRNVISTEAQFLLMRFIFDELGYRRFEWKCDSLNAPSRKTAQRLGFSFEGIFRQLTVYRERNRDTAWYSLIDKDWPAVRAAFEAWLDPANFDGEGQQLQPLRAKEALT